MPAGVIQGWGHRGREQGEEGRGGRGSSYHDPHALVVVHVAPDLNLPLLVHAILARKGYNQVSPRFEGLPSLPQHLPGLDQKLHRVGDEHGVEAVRRDGRRREREVCVQVLDDPVRQGRIGRHFLLVDAHTDEAGGGEGGREIRVRRGADFKKRPGGGKEAQVVLGQGICCLVIVDGGEIWSPIERDAVLLSARKVVVVVGPGLRPFPGRGGYLEGCGP